MDVYLRRTIRISVLLSVAGLGYAWAGFAQEAPQSPNAYGTSALTCYTLQAFEFSPWESTTSLQGDSALGRYAATGSNSTLEAPVRLPSGVAIDHFEMDVCDMDAGVNILSSLWVCTGATCGTPFGVISTTGTPGCTRVSSGLGSVVVDNQASSYVMQVSLNTVGSSVSLRAVRIFYKLQVSAGPAVATFADVPTTSPQFRFVEALVSAGITAGCGGGNYCPGDPVTRGQMAVFLAAALGLHFPN